MNLDNLAERPCEWLRGTGPESNIVISSRIRLARNLNIFPFAGRLSPEKQEELIELVRDASSRTPLLKKNFFIRTREMGLLERQFLVERHLVSLEFVNEKNNGALSLGDNEALSIMVLEEDHLRMQVLESGLNLIECWSVADRVDTELGKSLPFAFDEKLGFLTACPTNVGTGIRASAMLHLPGLVLTRQIEKVLQALSKLNMAVRGLYGEGSQASGNFFQISNQMTLGQKEEEIIDSLSRVIRQVVEHEKEARNVLKERKEERLTDQIWRAVGILKTARVISSVEATTYFSLVRLGLDLGVVKGITLKDINNLFINTQPGHMQKLAKKNLTVKERDSRRAEIIRVTLKGIEL